MSYGQLNDYYKLLGVERDAEPRELRRAYRKLVKQNHPDLTREPTERKRREEFLKLLNNAYEVLSDPALRTQYDGKLFQFKRSGQKTTYKYQKETEPAARKQKREAPDVVIRGNEHYMRLEYVRKRFKLKYDLGFYIRHNIITFYTTPDGYIYIPMSELERARATDMDPEAVQTGQIPKCVTCGVTNSTLRERYFVQNTGMLHIRKMRIRGGVLCSKCRELEKWKAVFHNLLLGWWGIEALVYNLGFIMIDLMGGFRGKRSTQSIYKKLRKFSVQQKQYDMFQELSGWRAKMAASLPHTLVDQLLYNNRQTLKAALFTILLIIIIVRILISI